MPKEKEVALTIPPGSYTLETLPPLSSGAKRILDELKAEADTQGDCRVAPRLRQEKLVGLRITPPKEQKR